MRPAPWVPIDREAPAYDGRVSALPFDLLVARRRRALRTLVAGVALGSTGHIAAVTVATIVAEDLTGTTAWSGAPGATVVLGAALGSTALSAVMARYGRRRGLVLGYAIGVFGALVATLAVVTRSFPLLLLGTTLIGFGNTANHLSRYAAADMAPAAGRAGAISTVVWGATVGAIVGPNLVGGAGGVATSMGLPALAGAYLVPMLFVTTAGLLSFLFLRPDPFELADITPEPAGGEASAPLSQILRRPAVVVALCTLVLAQSVMLLIMTISPLHMATHGHGLGVVGFVMSAHTFGMYALSPIAGRLTNRFGSVPVILLGSGILAIAAALSAAAPPDAAAPLFVALFLLGFGWNLGFVAGSTLLSGGVSRADRTRVQGLADTFVWSTGIVASLGSGLVAAGAGYSALGLGGLALVALLALVVFGGRGRVTAA